MIKYYEPEMRDEGKGELVVFRSFVFWVIVVFLAQSPFLTMRGLLQGTKKNPATTKILPPPHHHQFSTPLPPSKASFMVSSWVIVK
jgi:hypothetical protein